MSKAIAFLAGLGTGYFKGEDKKKDDARLAEKDAREKALFDANMADRKQTAEDKAALRVAGSPVAVTEAVPAGPVDPASDIPAAAEPMAPVASINGRAFASRGVADAEAAAMNTPQGTRARVMAALGAQGNVLGADQLRTSGLQADAAQMTLDKGKREEANAVFDLGIKEALRRGGPDALATFMSESHADGQGGKMKFKAVTMPDGKWQMHKLNEDGTTVPISGSFGREETDFATAGMMLSRGVGDDKKVAHLLQVKQQKDQADHNAAQLKIAQQNADTNEQWRKDQAENQRKQRALEEKRIAAAAKAIEVPPGVTWDKEADTFLRTRYTVKDADGNETVDGGGLIFAKQLAVAQASRNGGDTTAALGYAFQADNKIKQEAGGDPEKLRMGRVALLQKLMTPPAPPNAPTGSATPQPVAPGAQTGQNQANVPTAPSLVGTPFSNEALAAGRAAPAAARPAAVAAQGIQPQAAIPADKEAAMKPMADQLRTFQRALVQAGQSGDPAAIRSYAAQVNQARTALLTEATRKLGPDLAQQYVSTIQQ